MKTIVLRPCRDENLITAAAAILRRGGLVGIPTETVYGLGADGLNETAVAAIFTAKGRPQDNPLILHVPDVSWLPRCAREIPAAAYTLAARFWPGPLTMILPRHGSVPLSTTGGLDTVGVRCPDHALTRAIIAAADTPVAAPSGNLSGRPSPTTAAHMLADMDGRIDAIVDGGDCRVGVESTIVDLTVTPPRLLRPGGIPLEELEAVLGEVAVDRAVVAPPEEGVRPRAPGMKYRHYAPHAPVTVFTGAPARTAGAIRARAKTGDGVLLFEEFTGAFGDCTARSLGSMSDGESNAHRVFDALRGFDDTPVKEIFAQCPDDRGLGLAVSNRLKKAAGFHVIACGDTPRLIGLTGPTGAGKTTALAALRRLGAAIVDCDALYHEMLATDASLRSDVENAFGAVFDGTVLDRKKLGEAVFADPEALARLNAIVYARLPREAMRRAEASGATVVGIDAINLIESGMGALCDHTVAVLSPAEERIRRIMARDGVDEAYARLRVSAQKDDAFYRENCAFVLWNGEKTEREFSAEAETLFRSVLQGDKGGNET